MIIRAALFSLLSVLSFTIKGQYTSSPSNRFSVAEIKGCAPFNVTFNLPECGGLGCSIDYLGDKVDPKPVLEVGNFTYNTPGVYIVEVIIGTTGGPETLQITVTPNIPPDFDIYLCNGNQVRVNLMDNNYDQYFLNYNDGSPETLTANGLLPAKSYAPGVQTIDIRGKNNNAADNCVTSSQNVTVVAAPPARKITQLAVSDTDEVILDMEQGPGFQNVLYQLEMAVNNGATFNQQQNVHNANQEIINTLAPDDNNYYCFRLGKVDPCAGTVDYANTNIICSADLDATVENNNNRLNWQTNTAGGLLNFNINKNPAPAIPIQSNTTTIYNDGDIRCGTTYEYQLISNYGNNIRSISKRKSVAAISTDIPSTIENISMVINGSELDIAWLNDPAFTPETYSVLRSPTFASIGTSTTNSFVDPGYNPEFNHCYQLNYVDVCGNASATSNEACPIQLASTLNQNNTVGLNWNTYNGWATGVQYYVIEKYSAAGVLLSSNDVGLATTYLEPQDIEDANQIFNYRIVAISNNPLVPVSISNIINIIKTPNLYFPTAFVPNSAIADNRVFKAFGQTQYQAAFELKIFNRWGELLFETTNINEGWNGSFKGNVMPEGTYVYKSKFTDQVGRIFENAGTVVLLKK